MILHLVHYAAYVHDWCWEPLMNAFCGVRVFVCVMRLVMCN